MIVVRLMGGLGNQLFQYAAGRSLAAKHNTDLVLDLSVLEKKRNSSEYTNRAYALSDLNIKAKVSNDFAQEYLRVNQRGLLSRIRRRVLGYSEYFRYEMPVDPAFEELGKNMILEGYFQSEKYFSGIRKELQQELLPSTAYQVDERITSTLSVGVHFRRGDFSQLAAASKVNGTCDLSYYQKAVEVMNKKLKAPAYFVFSDDIQWVKDNFSFERDKVVYIENTGSDAWLQDFEMLKSCRHQIIANSTFSWWAAWLNPNQEKVVIAPKKWFNDPSLKHDLLPNTWLKL